MSLTTDDILDDAHIWLRDYLLPEVNTRYSHRPNSDETMDEIEDFVTTKCYEKGFLVRVKTAECLLGIGPLDIEITGVTQDHEMNRHGVDRERHRWNVLRSNERGEEDNMKRWLRELNDKG
jgi:hypothetical protein